MNTLPDPTRISPLPNAKAREEVDVLVIGGGLAGTSLAHHLETLGFGGRVAIVEARRDFSTEARWCSWGKIPDGMQGLVSHQWHRWEVRDERNTATQASKSQPYQHIYAPDFFRHFHQQFARTGRTELYLGHSTTQVTPQKNGVEVSSIDANGNLTQWRANRVFDARGLAHPRLEQPRLEQPRPAQKIHWRQSFAGLLVQFEEDVFDAETMTMMDFRVPQSDGVKFIYILPFSPRRALVEVTSFAPRACSRESLEPLLLRYLKEHLGGRYQTLSRESGDLPMDTARMPSRLGRNWAAIGLCGGAGRAATGYAFGRIQRQTAWIAQTLAGGGDPLEGNTLNRLTLSPKFEAFDEIFLEALGHGPKFAASCFYRLIERVGADSLTRFLEEESNAWDELQLVAALPKINFIRAATRRVLVRSGRRLPAASAIRTLKPEGGAPVAIRGAAR